MLKPIRTEQEYQAALARVEEIFDAKPNTPELDELEILSMLIDSYEEQHFFIDMPDPIEAIQFVMEQKGLTRKDLANVISSTSGRVSEILNKKRSLTLPMVRKINEAFRVPAEILIQNNDSNV